MKNILVENLKKLKFENNITTRQLAKAIGVHAKTIANWENAKTTPHLRYLILLAKFYNVKLSYLVGLKNSNKI